MPPGTARRKGTTGESTPQVPGEATSEQIGAPAGVQGYHKGQEDISSQVEG